MSVVEELEVGDRAVEAMERENRGVVVQRVQAIASRRIKWGWRFHFATDGTPTHMTWGMRVAGR